MTELTANVIDFDLPYEDLILPSAESDSSELDSDETLLSGSNNQIADLSKEGSGDINAPSPTESEVLKTAMDKLPPLDI